MEKCYDAISIGWFEMILLMASPQQEEINLSIPKKSHLYLQEVSAEEEIELELGCKAPVSVPRAFEEVKMMLSNLPFVPVSWPSSNTK